MAPLSDKINERIIKKDSILVTIVIFVMIITVFAWQCDDAYHGYAMARNLVEGHGFVYNIGERVCASTAPLYTLIIALGYFLCRYMFPVSLFIDILFSSLAAYIVFKYFCKTSSQVLASGVVMVLSNCFIAYTTSGLENCFLFLLSAVFLKLYYGKEKYNSRILIKMALIISLLAMTRMDAVLIFIPMILYAYLVRRDNVSFTKAVLYGLLGLMPFVMWLAFSTFYYGFPFPNTFYAKLGTGFSRTDYLVRGWEYVYTTLIYDPVVVLTPIFTVLTAVLSRKRPYCMCAIGILIYLAYVISIGGDFMVGRHFTVIFFISLISILWSVNNGGYTGGLNKSFDKIWLIALIMGLLAITVLRPVSRSMLYPYGPIADERDYYFSDTSLIINAIYYAKTGELKVYDAHLYPDYEFADLEASGIHDAYLYTMAAGVTVYHHPDSYLTDRFALGDPILSRLPAIWTEDWRVGHMERDLPAGYDVTIYCGENLIENESLHEYCDIMRLITRGPLFSEGRLIAIVNMNLGKYDYLIEDYAATLDENNRRVDNTSEME